MLWKRETVADEQIQLSDLAWLSDNKTAVARVSVVTLLPERTRVSGGKEQKYRPQSVDTSLLITSATSKTVRPVSLAENGEAIPMVQIVPSPTDNRALITTAPEYDKAKTIRLLSASGALTEPKVADVGNAMFSGWTVDGRIVGFAMPNGTNGWTESRDIAVDAKTGEVTLTERSKDGKPNPAIRTVIRTTPGGIAPPVWVVSGTAPFTPSDNKRTIPLSPVLIRSATDETETALVALHGDPVGVLGAGENLTVLYHANDALYGVALKRTARADYEQALRGVSRLNALGLLMQLKVWEARNDNQVPPPQSDIPALLRDAAKETDQVDNDHLFLDPITGKPAFTYLYTAPGGDTSTPLFSLATIGGRFVAYTKGFAIHFIADGAPIPSLEPEAKP